MPRKYLMNWDGPPNNRWRKMYKGATYSVTCVELDLDKTLPRVMIYSKEGSGKAADEWWRRKAAALAGLASADKVRQGVIGYIKARTGEEVGTFDEAEEKWHRLAKEIDRAADPEQGAEDLGAAVAVFKGEVAPEAIPQGVARAGSAATVGAMVDRWLKLERQRQRVGQLGGARADSNRVCLCHFRDWVGKDAPVSEVNGGKWQDWYSHLAEKRAAGEWSASHVDRILQVSKRFVRALWEWELIDLPRNLDNKTLAFEVPPKQVELFTGEELKALYGAVKGQSRLHVLLMLNCGMLAKDVNDLRPDEVDWTAGVITRKRSKTANHEDVPLVRYKLWRRTFDLLKEYRSADAEAVLLTVSGQRWIQPKQSDSGWSRSDSIRSCLRNYMTAAKVDRPVKALRATAASKLAEHKDYKFYTQYFLGHSPRSVADKHYVVPSQAEFDKALAWLDKALGI